MYYAIANEYVNKPSHQRMLLWELLNYFKRNPNKA